MFNLLGDVSCNLFQKKLQRKEPFHENKSQADVDSRLRPGLAYQTSHRLAP